MQRSDAATSGLLGAIREAVAPPARLLSDEDRREAEQEIYDGGRLTRAYGFMLFSACGIAALGLLQSSVAVVIGAMLISPLMGPIMAMGMALARLRPRAFKSAATTLLVGAFLSVLASTLIVWASPLKEVTPEILARTRPTLLDLIVALLSGFVGAYLTINRKGAAIAGVAIATALMPPLAVVGFGLATGAWPVAGGAFLLFLTNVIAILGSVFVVARRYGYRPGRRQGAAWELVALLGVMLLLCVPLAVSLRGIVTEARETSRARDAINKAFDGGSPHITELTVDTDHGPTNVQSVVVTRKYVPGAAAAIAAQLDPAAKVEVEQIVTATSAATTTGVSALGGRIASQTAPGNASPERRLRTMLGPLGDIEAIEAGPDGELVVTFAFDRPASLADYRIVEQAAQRFLPGTTVHIPPPLTDLPAIPFTRGSTALGAEGLETADLIAWALERWSIVSVQVVGSASPNPKGRRPGDLRVAQARADALADALRQRGVGQVTTRADVPEVLTGDEAAYLVARVVPRPAP